MPSLCPNFHLLIKRLVIKCLIKNKLGEEIHLALSHLTLKPRLDTINFTHQNVTYQPGGCCSNRIVQQRNTCVQKEVEVSKSCVVFVDVQQLSTDYEEKKSKLDQNETYVQVSLICTPYVQVVTCLFEHKFRVHSNIYFKIHQFCIANFMVSMEKIFGLQFGGSSLTI